MLLYALRNAFFERRLPRSQPPDGSALPDAAAMIAAGSFVAIWCLLRLWAARDGGLGVDAAIAMLCLPIGLRAAHRGVVGARAALSQP